jgi:hypothetical protein
MTKKLSLLTNSFFESKLFLKPPAIVHKNIDQLAVVLKSQNCLWQNNKNVRKASLNAFLTKKVALF